MRSMKRMLCLALTAGTGKCPAVNRYNIYKLNPQRAMSLRGFFLKMVIPYMVQAAYQTPDGRLSADSSAYNRMGRSLIKT